MRSAILFTLAALILSATPVVAQVCTPGFFSQDGTAPCMACPAGRFTADEGSVECFLCPMGTFQPNEGSVACMDCPDGYIAPQVGSAECQPCLPGFTSNGTHTECVEESVDNSPLTWGVLKAIYR